MTREELATRIEAFKRDLPRLNAPVVAATMLGFLVMAASIYFKRRGSEFPHPILLLGVVVTILGLITRWWLRNLNLLRQKHGLLCPCCGKLIAKTGWKTVLQTGRCERCSATL